MRRESDKWPRDAAIARIAANQHGAITTAQLTGAGLSSGRISERVASGRLHRIHRGVYAVGHQRLSEEGRWMAAVLACGDAAVLSHESAARLWGIRRRVRRLSAAGGRGLAPATHVTVPGTTGRKKHAGIVLHRSTTLDAKQRTRRAGISVTTPARTLSDLRPQLSSAEFAAALREAEFLGLPIRERFKAEPTRSELEQRFVALCRRHRLPKPAVNARVDRYEVDFLWSEQRLIAECDGWDSHRSRSAFEEDRARDARLKLLGHEVLRFTWRQVTRDPRGVVRTIRTLLKRRARA